MGITKVIGSALGVAAMVAGGLTAMATPASAGSPNCPRGYFCAWQHTSYNGHREAWYGNDHYWGNNSNINNQDSSWQNNGYTGGRDHVAVFSGYYRYGDRTICLRPGSSVYYKGWANDRGSSHSWIENC